MEIEKIDARKLSTDAQKEKRILAMRLRDKGMKNSEVAQIVGVNPGTVSIWRSRYLKDGKRGIEIGQRGRKIGDKKRLTSDQEKKIITKLIDTTPQQLKFKFALWTREAVQTLIKYEIDIDMPISTVGYYLAKWKFTSKKPIKRAYERKDKATKAWLEGIESETELESMDARFLIRFTKKKIKHGYYVKYNNEYYHIEYANDYGDSHEYIEIMTK